MQGRFLPEGGAPCVERFAPLEDAPIMADQALVQRLTRLLAERADGLVCAWLFGSQARGDARQGSDVDVAVLFAEDPPRTLAGLRLDLADDLAGALGCPVDLVVMNRAPIDLVHRVLRDGVLLFDRDPSARIRFEVRARAQWLDLLPHIERYRRVPARRAP